MTHHPQFTPAPQQDRCNVCGCYLRDGGSDGTIRPCPMGPHEEESA